LGASVKTVGSSEAKTHLSRLLREVEVGHEEVVIRRHNRNVACLIPYESYRPGERKGSVDYVAGLKEIRAGVRGKGSIRDSRDKGRER
jgi:prevent-host-death family protein